MARAVLLAAVLLQAGAIPLHGQGRMVAVPAACVALARAAGVPLSLTVEQARRAVDELERRVTADADPQLRRCAAAAIRLRPKLR